MTLRMIESASAEHVPYDVLKKQPHWLNQQISDYMEEFVGAPAPDPLESWRVARRAAQLAEVKALAEAEAKAAEQAKALAATAEQRRRPPPDRDRPLRRAGNHRGAGWAFLRRRACVGLWRCRCRRCCVGPA